MTRSPEKLHTDENEIVCWHYDHSKSRSVKGINVVSPLYRTADLSLPVAFEAVEKTEWTDPDEEGRFTRHARETKNEQLRRIAQEIIVEQRQEIDAMRLALGRPPLPLAPLPTQPPIVRRPGSGRAFCAAYPSISPK